MNKHAECQEFSPAVSVVAPCFNEEEVIPQFIERMSEACRCAVGDEYEVILINDGSHDSTWSLISAAVRKYKRIVGVNLARNHGHQLALSAGLSLCRGQRVLIIDADLQDPPELLTDMMALMNEGYDVVYGQRAGREGETWLKRLTAAAFYRLLQMLTNVQIPVDTGDFRLINRRILERLKAMPEQHRFVRGLVAWLGGQQVAFPYKREPRFAGKTKYTIGMMIGFAIDAITGFSVAPLRLVIYIGLLSIVLASVLGIYVLYSWLVLGTVQGWTSLMVVILAFGGIQLFSLAVIGEYIGRTYMQTKGRPLFLINEVLVHDDAHPELVGYRQLRDMG